MSGFNMPGAYSQPSQYGAPHQSQGQMLLSQLNFPGAKPQNNGMLQPNTPGNAQFYNSHPQTPSTFSFPQNNATTWQNPMPHQATQGYRTQAFTGMQSGIHSPYYPSPAAQQTPTFMHSPYLQSQFPQSAYSPLTPGFNMQRSSVPPTNSMMPQMPKAIPPHVPSNQFGPTATPTMRSFEPLKPSVQENAGAVMKNQINATMNQQTSILPGQSHTFKSGNLTVQPLPIQQPFSSLSQSNGVRPVPAPIITRPPPYLTPSQQSQQPTTAHISPLSNATVNVWNAQNQPGASAQDSKTTVGPQLPGSIDLPRKPVVSSGCIPTATMSVSQAQNNGNLPKMPTTIPMSNNASFSNSALQGSVDLPSLPNISANQVPPNPGALKQESLRALKELHDCGITLPQLIGEGLDQNVLRELYQELNLLSDDVKKLQIPEQQEVPPQASIEKAKVESSKPVENVSPDVPEYSPAEVTFELLEKATVPASHSSPKVSAVDESVPESTTSKTPNLSVNTERRTEPSLALNTPTQVPTPTGIPAGMDRKDYIAQMLAAKSKKTTVDTKSAPTLTPGVPEPKKIEMAKPSVSAQPLTGKVIPSSTQVSTTKTSDTKLQPPAAKQMSRTESERAQSQTPSKKRPASAQDSPPSIRKDTKKQKGLNVPSPFKEPAAPSTDVSRPSPAPPVSQPKPPAVIPVPVITISDEEEQATQELRSMISELQAEEMSHSQAAEKTAKEIFTTEVAKRSATKQLQIQPSEALQQKVRDFETKVANLRALLSQTKIKIEEARTLRLSLMEELDPSLSSTTSKPIEASPKPPVAEHPNGTISQPQSAGLTRAETLSLDRNMSSPAIITTQMDVDIPVNDNRETEPVTTTKGDNVPSGVYEPPEIIDTIMEESSALEVPLPDDPSAAPVPITTIVNDFASTKESTQTRDTSSSSPDSERSASQVEVPAATSAAVGIPTRASSPPPLADPLAPLFSISREEAAARRSQAQAVVAPFVPVGRFERYKSPLQFSKFFRLNRFYPQFLSSADGYRSSTFSHRINAHAYFCLNELLDGVCPISNCGKQHFQYIRPDDQAIIAELATSREGLDEAQRSAYMNGLSTILQSFQSSGSQNLLALIPQIVEYRRLFTGDDTRYLPSFVDHHGIIRPYIA